MSFLNASEVEKALCASHDTPSKLYPRSSANWASVAQYLNKDPDLWVFRRFGKLHLFNILQLQKRLAELENILETKIREGDTTGFDELLPDIKIALKEYDDALSAQAKYRSYQKPEKHIFTLFERSWNHFHSRFTALRIGLDFHTEGKRRYEDLASIAAIEKSWIHKFIDSHECLSKFFSKNDNFGGQLPTTLIYSEENVQRAEAVFLHACFCCLLLCPIIALSYVHSNTWKLVILAISLLVTSALTVGFLNAPNKNALALVAGYAAILVVFLSNGVGS